LSAEVATEADLAAQVLELVRGVEAEVLVEHGNEALTRFANSYIHQNVGDAVTTVRLRVHAGGRTATTTTTRLDALDELGARTLAALALAPADPTWPGLTPPTPTDGFQGNVDEATAEADPADRAARVRAFVDACEGLSTAGYVSTSSTRVAYANSLGHHAFGATTSAGLDAIARTATSDGLARQGAVRLGDLDGAVLGARAATKARAGADPTELPAGRYEVVLEPAAVADLLQIMAFYGFNAKAVRERRSFVELGTPQFDPAITLVDDVRAPGAAGLPFDVEGTPRGRTVLVDAGTPVGLAHDRRTAAKEGTASNGGAIPGGASWGAVPSSLVLSAQAGAGGAAHEVDGPALDSAVAALVAQVGRGLLVSANHYTRVLDPRTLVVTGLTRNGVWLIEDGVVTTPVKNFRFTQSYPLALAPGAVLGVGSHTVRLPGDWTDLACAAPALRLASWNYTGNASG
jgi:predicted Zn-dependent protease